MTKKGMDKTLRDISKTLWPKKEEENMSATCIYCEREFKGGNLFQHMWDAHREQMLKARRDREDCKSGQVSDILGKHGGSTPRTSTLDNPDEDAAEQQATIEPLFLGLGGPYEREDSPFMPKGVPPVEDPFAKQINELAEIAKSMPTERRWDIKLAVLEIADGVLNLATLRITRG
jgi:hypothetical protein